MFRRSFILNENSFGNKIIDLCVKLEFGPGYREENMAFTPPRSKSPILLPRRRREKAEEDQDDVPGFPAVSPIPVVEERSGMRISQDELSAVVQNMES